MILSFMSDVNNKLKLLFYESEMKGESPERVVHSFRSRHSPAQKISVAIDFIYIRKNNGHKHSNHKHKRCEKDWNQEEKLTQNKANDVNGGNNGIRDTLTKCFMRDQGEQSERDVEKAKVPLGEASEGEDKDEYKIHDIFMISHDKPSDVIVSVQPGIVRQNTDVAQDIHVHQQQVVR